jgi:hypothetical protein
MISFYYANTLRNIVDVLSSKFTGMTVNRYAKDGITIIESIDVPYMFSPVSKIYMDRLQDFSAEPESLGQRYYQTTPRLALNLTSVDYDSNRVVGAQEQRFFKDSELNSLFSDLMPTPYNFSFSLGIKTRRIGDFSQILENILPYFNPKLYLSVKEFSFLNIERDLPVSLLGSPLNFTDTLDKTQMREINGDINFLVEGYLYRPISTQKMVKIIKTKFYVGYTEEPSVDATLVHEFQVSAVPATSAGDLPVSGVPEDFTTSAFDILSNQYYFTSANDVQ